MHYFYLFESFQAVVRGFMPGAPLIGWLSVVIMTFTSACNFKRDVPYGHVDESEH